MTQSMDTAKTEAFVGRLFNATLGVVDMAGVYLGDRLGLYKTLAQDGPTTSTELAQRAGIHERYAREWLEQQAATGILSVDDVAADASRRRYALPPEHAIALTDPESPFPIAPLARAVMGMMPLMPKIMKAWRTGTGIPWAAYGADTIESQGDFNRPWLLGQLGAEFLPKVPDVHQRLNAKRPAARVLDVACGVGWAGIAIAQAYPNAKVLGLDPDRLSIKLAKQNAIAKGVAKQVKFQALDVAKLDRKDKFDLAVIIESVHDMSQPVPVLSAIRKHLAPGGTLIVADERTGESFSAPADDVERFLYGASMLLCLVNSMAETPTVATGTVMRPSTMTRYAMEAGFQRVDVLDQIEHPFLRFYRLVP